MFKELGEYFLGLQFAEISESVASVQIHYVVIFPLVTAPNLLRF
jgi:hypothetical protein